jgi:hypothetical protein
MGRLSPSTGLVLYGIWSRAVELDNVGPPSQAQALRPQRHSPDNSSAVSLVGLSFVNPLVNDPPANSEHVVVKSLLEMDKRALTRTVREMLHRGDRHDHWVEFLLLPGAGHRSQGVWCSTLIFSGTLSLKTVTV